MEPEPKHLQHRWHKVRSVLMEFVPHGVGDGWQIIERILGIVLTFAIVAFVVGAFINGCALVTVNAGSGVIEEAKGAIILKGAKQNESNR